MDPRLIEAVERIGGARVVDARPTTGGFSHNSKWIATLADGGTVFVKAAVDEDTTRWHAVLETLGELERTPPPDDLPAPGALGELRGGWRTVAADPEPFLELGLCTDPWLRDALPALGGAADRAEFEGDALLHLDVRSDNLCFRGGQCVLFHWNWAARGNPLLDLVLWLPSLHLEGGPPPERFTTPAMAELTAVAAGYFAARAGLPEPPAIPAPGVRAFQLAQLRIALPWAATSLGLPPPA
jgi:aminoglycoside phosphotransferase (APT) family kinase protein